LKFKIAMMSKKGLYGLKNIDWRSDMKKVEIKYNPYKIRTRVTVDGKELKENSRLAERIDQDQHLQAWVEDLPDILVSEYNDTEFDIEFYGTNLDYEDLKDIFELECERKGITVRLNKKDVKENFDDKEERIAQVFEKIKKGPFEELKSDKITNAFENVKNDNFEVCVVATMSAGKSTLINSMLGTKLMPSKQEACTAIITRITDDDKAKGWQADVYGKVDKKNPIESYNDLTYKTMERLNEDEKVSEIKITGNIPFVSSKEMSLVLIDTPGPNNARDPKHGEVQRKFLESSPKSLVLYVMESTFGNDSDDKLLNDIAKSMEVGGKQSKDRYIFVVNKMDGLQKEDGKTEGKLERVREYLKDHHGIANPNLFPAAALPALNIRLINSGTEVDEDTSDETEMKVRKLNRNEELHLEKYASLPKSISRKIEEKCETARESNDSYEEALIHTGIPSIEAAIRQYVQKYAKTAKVKSLVETFIGELESSEYMTKMELEFKKDKKNKEKIIEKINGVERKVEDLKSAKKFKEAVDDAVSEVNNKSNDIINDILKNYKVKIIEAIHRHSSNGELGVNEAKDEVKKLERDARRLESDFQIELDRMIGDNLIRTGNALVSEYKNKLKSLTEEINIEGMSVNIDPLKMMSGSISADNFSIDSLMTPKEIEDGEELVEVPRKPILGLGIRDALFGMKKEWRTKYKTVEYVNASTMAQEFFSPIEDSLRKSCEDAKSYAKSQSDEIAGSFKKQFKRLDDVLKDKLNELKSYATDKKEAEERVKESKAKLEWLKNIKNEVESILEI
jgi:GTPase Era involved in 16S rRNA processing